MKPEVPAATLINDNPETKVDPPLVNRNGAIELDPPPGYFDLPAPNKKDGTDPPAIKVGQTIVVEVLEALPGRPIQADHVVRPDGTISLGFYGDLHVAGLNRYQIKCKVIELLREHLKDEVLGLWKIDRVSGKAIKVPPVESNRVFVDDSSNYETRNGPKPSDATTSPVADLRDEVTKLRKELDDLRNERRSPK